jgi:hypothetical protein
MNATTGTNAFTWANAAAFWGSILSFFLTPDTITGLLGSKYAIFAPAVLALINWLGHGMTGNSATSVLPGVLPPTTPSISQQG